MSIRPISDANYARFRSLIVQRTGLDFPPSRRADLAGGLRQALNRLYANTDEEDTGPLVAYEDLLQELYAALEQGDATAWECIITQITVCETHFYRHVPQFTALRSDILPRIIAARREVRPLSMRLWSAGCASGEETYSLAILLRELLPDLPLWTVDLLGTDINREALETARRGLFREWSFRELPAQQWRSMYFHRVGTQYQLQDDLRTMARFEPYNLLDERAGIWQRLGQQDLILCRNVVLYFGARVRRGVYRHLYDSLKPGGWLVVGHADPPPTDYADFIVEQVGGSIFYQRPVIARDALPRRRERAADALPFPTEAPPAAEGNDDDAEAHYRLGLWHANRQHWDEALLHCQRAIELQPAHNPAPHYTLALIYQALGQRDLAIDYLRHAIYLASDWPLPRFMLAGLYREIGEPRHALRELRNVVELTQRLPPETIIPGSDSLTAARLRAAAERQLQQDGPFESG